MAKVILFQGDSITDAGRSRDNDLLTGTGYVRLTEAELGCTYPLLYTCYNRGISGNRIVDVYARIKADIINLAPDYMSILIGINDVWHEYTRQNGVSAEKFERIYDMLIHEIKEALPDIKIMILEPFVLTSAKKLCFVPRELVVLPKSITSPLFPCRRSLTRRRRHTQASGSEMVCILVLLVRALSRTSGFMPSRAFVRNNSV